MGREMDASAEDNLRLRLRLHFSRCIPDERPALRVAERPVSEELAGALLVDVCT